MSTTPTTNVSSSGGGGVATSSSVSPNISRTGPSPSPSRFSSSSPHPPGIRPVPLSGTGSPMLSASPISTNFLSSGHAVPKVPLVQFIVESGPKSILKDYLPSIISTHYGLSIKETDIAQVIGMMAATQSQLLLTQRASKVQITAPSGAPIQSTASSSLASHPTLLMAFDGWNWADFVDVISELFPYISWTAVIGYLDYPEFYLQDVKGVELIVRSYYYASRHSGAPVEFPIYLFTQKIWENAPGQLSFLRYSLMAPSELGIFATVVKSSSRRLLNMEELEMVGGNSPTSSSTQTQVQSATGITLSSSSTTNTTRNVLLHLFHQPWNALDLLEVTVHLLDVPPCYEDARALLELAAKQAPELLCLGLATLRVGWATPVGDLLAKLTGGFLVGQPGASIVLPRLWRISPSVLLGVMGEMHRRDPSCVSRLLDIAQDLKALPVVLAEARSPTFAIDLAALASRREHLNLDKWLQEVVRDRREPFLRALVEYVYEHLMMATPSSSSSGVGINSTTGGGGMSVDGSLQRRAPIPPSTEALSLMIKTLAASVPLMSTECAERWRELAHRLQSRGIPGLILGSNHATISTIVPNTTIVTSVSPKNVVPFNPLVQSYFETCSFQTEIETEANACYERIYAQEASVQDVLEIMIRLRASNNPRDAMVFNCMIHNLLDEFRFFSKYPEKELALTGVIFGQLLHTSGLLEGAPLFIALRMVTEALVCYGSDTKLWRFGMTALAQCAMDLVTRWPRLCKLLLINVPGLASFPSIAERLRQCTSEDTLGDHSPVSSSTTTISSSIPISPSGEETELLRYLEGISFLNTFQTNSSQDTLTSSFLSLSERASKPLNAEIARLPPHIRRWIISDTNFKSTTDINNTLDGGIASNYRHTQDQSDISADPAGAERLQFLINNVVQSNVAEKACEIAAILYSSSMEELGPWLARHLVSARICINSPHQHVTYLRLVLLVQQHLSILVNDHDNSTSGYGIATTKTIHDQGPTRIMEYRRGLDPAHGSEGFYDNTNYHRGIDHSFQNYIERGRDESIMKATDPTQMRSQHIEFSFRNQNASGRMRDSPEGALLNWTLLAAVVSARAMLVTASGGGVLSNNSSITYNVGGSALKNLGSWIGLVTLGLQRPLLHNYLPIKEMLLEAHDSDRLSLVLPFVCRVLEGISHQKMLLLPRNPWLMKVLGLVVEIYHFSNPPLKLNLKFEVELLFKNLYLSLEPPSISGCGEHLSLNDVTSFSSNTDIFSCGNINTLSNTLSGNAVSFSSGHQGSLYGDNSKPLLVVVPPARLLIAPRRSLDIWRDGYSPNHPHHKASSGSGSELENFSLITTPSSQLSNSIMTTSVQSTRNGDTSSQMFNSAFNFSQMAINTNSSFTIQSVDAAVLATSAAMGIPSTIGRSYLSAVAEVLYQLIPATVFIQSNTTNGSGGSAEKCTPIAHSPMISVAAPGSPGLLGVILLAWESALRTLIIPQELERFVNIATVTATYLSPPNNVRDRVIRSLAGHLSAAVLRDLLSTAIARFIEGYSIPLSLMDHFHVQKNLLSELSERLAIIGAAYAAACVAAGSIKVHSESTPHTDAHSLTTTGVTPLSTVSSLTTPAISGTLSVSLGNNASSSIPGINSFVTINDSSAMTVWEAFGGWGSGVLLPEFHSVMPLSPLGDIDRIRITTMLGLSSIPQVLQKEMDLPEEPIDPAIPSIDEFNDLVSQICELSVDRRLSSSQSSIPTISYVAPHSQITTAPQVVSQTKTGIMESHNHPPPSSLRTLMKQVLVLALHAPNRDETCAAFAQRLWRILMSGDDRTNEHPVSSASINLPSSGTSGRLAPHSINRIPTVFGLSSISSPGQNSILKPSLTELLPSTISALVLLLDKLCELSSRVSRQVSGWILDEAMKASALYSVIVPILESGILSLLSFDEALAKTILAEKNILFIENVTNLTEKRSNANLAGINTNLMISNSSYKLPSISDGPLIFGKSSPSPTCHSPTSIECKSRSLTEDTSTDSLLPSQSTNKIIPSTTSVQDTEAIFSLKRTVQWALGLIRASSFGLLPTDHHHFAPFTLYDWEGTLRACGSAAMQEYLGISPSMFTTTCSSIDRPIQAFESQTNWNDLYKVMPLFEISVEKRRSIVCSLFDEWCRLIDAVSSSDKTLASFAHQATIKGFFRESSLMDLFWHTALCWASQQTHSPHHLSVPVQEIHNSTAHGPSSSSGTGSYLLGTHIPSESDGSPRPVALARWIVFLIRTWPALTLTTNYDGLTPVLPGVSLLGMDPLQLLSRFWAVFCKFVHFDNSEYCTDSKLEEKHTSTFKDDRFSTLKETIMMKTGSGKYQGMGSFSNVATNSPNLFQYSETTADQSQDSITTTAVDAFVVAELLGALLVEWHAAERLLDPAISDAFMGLFGEVMHILNPQSSPRLAFAWLDVLSHRFFMPRLLLSTRGVDALSTTDDGTSGLSQVTALVLLLDALAFWGNLTCNSSTMIEDAGDSISDIQQAISSQQVTGVGRRALVPTTIKPEFPPNQKGKISDAQINPKTTTQPLQISVALRFHHGLLRLFLVLLHDFPEFLAAHHWQLVQAMPCGAFQLRNLVLSAFPRHLKLLDPFTPSLKIEALPECLSFEGFLSPSPALDESIAEVGVFLHSIDPSIKSLIDDILSHRSALIQGVDHKSMLYNIQNSTISTDKVPKLTPPAGSNISRPVWISALVLYIVIRGCSFFSGSVCNTSTTSNITYQGTPIGVVPLFGSSLSTSNKTRSSSDSPRHVSDPNGTPFIDGDTGISFLTRMAALLITKMLTRMDSDNEGRYLLISAVVNQLRYPNPHTLFCSMLIKDWFRDGISIHQQGSSDNQLNEGISFHQLCESISRVLLERLVVQRPHPWGLLITFVELIRSPVYRFWQQPFARSSPDVERLFDTVARSCMQESGIPSTTQSISLHSQ